MNWNIPNGWQELLAEALQTPRLQALSAFLRQELQAGKTIYPARENWFAALNAVPLDKVRVVILGQDPYHGEGQAHGFSFSVPEGVKLPPSLRNIYKELQADLATQTPLGGDLTAWAKQGVLLLNTSLTVEAGLAASHSGKGWEVLTDRIISLVSEQARPVVFILWGNHARKKRDLIIGRQHLVIESAHPSPLSARHGFFGSKPFSKTNAFLAENGLNPINWTV